MNNLNKNLAKNLHKFNCETCDFHTSNKTNYDIHVSTRKHKNKVVSNKFEQKSCKILQEHVCSNCNTSYKNRSGLWYHLKKCKETKAIINHLIPDQDKHSAVVLDTENVLELIKQNQEFKSLILDQQDKILGQQDKILEQQDKIIELAGKPTSVTTTTNNNTNNFNLNFFLNETCKDAMNINDFIQNLNIQLKELENVGNNGYVVGISDIIVSRIKGLEISKRPLHCTDAKRETMYIKNENEWNKDNDDKSKLKNIIGQVAKENMRKIPEWREQNPECQDMHNTKYEYCMKLMRNSLGELDEKQDKMDEKIIKNIAKQVTIDK
jgi:hypothetical protein